MEVIKVVRANPDLRMLYRLAKTPCQRALVGYMVKKGMTHNPIFGGAFNALRSIEFCMKENIVYAIDSLEDVETTREIISVVQSALNGRYDMFAFDKSEINNIILCLNSESK